MFDLNFESTYAVMLAETLATGGCEEEFQEWWNTLDQEDKDYWKQIVL